MRRRSMRYRGFVSRVCRRADAETTVRSPRPVATGCRLNDAQRRQSCRVIQVAKQGFTHAGAELYIIGTEALSDPYWYFEPCATGPVIRVPRHKTRLLLDHKNCVKALRDRRFSSNRINPVIARKLCGPDVSPLVWAALEVLADWMVFKDGNDHATLRGLLARAFIPEAASSIRSRVEDLSGQLLAQIPKDGEFGLIKAFAIQVPSITIAEVLGVPVADREQFNHWSEEVPPVASAGIEDRGRYNREAAGVERLSNYLRGLLRRYQVCPEDNLITAMHRAAGDDNTLPEAEILATCTLILFGGHATTANLIAKSILGLLRHTDEFEMLRNGVNADHVE